MPTYSQPDFERIATAVGIDVNCVRRHASLFEAGRIWFDLDERRPPRMAPSKRRERLLSISKSAHRLLDRLGIKSPEEGVAGVGDTEILEALALIGDRNEDVILEATRRIARLAEILEGIAAVRTLESRAIAARDEVAEIGNLTVLTGNSGDAAVNGWIDAMMNLYRTITGREPGTSVGGPGQHDEGIARGPLIRFLEAAGKPLQIEYSEDAWRSRVRTILKDAPPQN